MTDADIAQHYLRALPQPPPKLDPLAARVQHLRRCGWTTEQINAQFKSEREGKRKPAKVKVKRGG